MHKYHQKETNYFYRNRKLKQLNKKKGRLLQNSNNTLSSSQVQGHDEYQSALPTSDPSLTRDNGWCILGF
uniref:Uncharacterized protein n=1 Tax=Solanum tuberosum TaxID=4113 RepID=M1A570_SOLTU